MQAKKKIEERLNKYFPVDVLGCRFHNNGICKFKAYTVEHFGDELCKTRENCYHKQQERLKVKIAEKKQELQELEAIGGNNEK